MSSSIDDIFTGADYKVDVKALIPEQASRNVILSPRETDNRRSVLQDFETARENMLEIIENGQKAINDLAALSNQAQSDKYYMALSSLMKTITDANFRLLELQEKIREIENEENHPSHVTNQVVITSAELLKLIKKDT